MKKENIYHAYFEYEFNGTSVLSFCVQCKKNNTEIISIETFERGIVCLAKN